jgi:secreted trypsin-like serine protease
VRAHHRIAVAVALAALAAIAPTTAASARTYAPQVISGQRATIGEYPFMVALLDATIDDDGDAFFCGGSLISESWVLTAAHCVEGSEPEDVDVLVGTVDIEGGTRVHVTDVIVHEGFGFDDLGDDVALLELAHDVGGITPVTLATSGTTLERTGTELTLTGWGVTEPDGDDASRYLQEADMPVIDDRACEASTDADTEGILCAGAPEDDDDGGIDSCYGDSGGPLFGTEDGHRVQIGIVSFGVEERCGVGLSAYTRVSAYEEWIAEHADLEVGPPTVTRVSGANRYATAADFATERWDGPLDTAFVVTGDSFPDALAAAAAAAQGESPVLLTGATSLPAETAAALRELEPARISVVGGPGAVSDAVLAQLDALTTSGATRIAGTSRYDTAATLSRESFDLPSAVFLASGESFADALGAAGAAAHEGAPLLLTARDALPDATRTELARIGPDVVYVLGGAASVSDAVVRAVEGLGITVDRLAGVDRYATTLAVLGHRFGTSGEIVIASGTAFPDGLVAGALGRPVVLVPLSDLSSTTTDALHDAHVHRVTILGGTGAVSSAVETALRAGPAT